MKEDSGLRLSLRGQGHHPNRLETVRRQLVKQGLTLRQISDSNPTQYGLFDPRIPDVLARHLDSAIRYTPDPKGWLPAREALAARFGGQPDDYWLTASTSEAYSWLLTALADPGASVAVPQPGYPLFEALTQLTSLRLVTYDSHYFHPSGWEYDLDSVKRALDDPGIRAFVIVSPNNPTGAYIGQPDCQVITKLLIEKRLPLIADEVFFPFTLDDSPHQRVAEMTQLADADSVVITLDGCSKLLAAPQLKLSWLRLQGPAKLTRPLADSLDMIADAFLSVNSIVACALPDLLELANDCIERVASRCRANLATLSELGDNYRVRQTQAGWMALVDLPPVFETDAMPETLLQAGLDAHPGWFYDIDSSTVIALSLLPEPSMFADSLQQIQTITGGLKCSPANNVSVD